MQKNFANRTNEIYVSGSLLWGFLMAFLRVSFTQNTNKSSSFFVDVNYLMD